MAAMAANPVSLGFLPRPLRKALLDFQKQGVRFGIGKQGSLENLMLDQDHYLLMISLATSEYQATSFTCMGLGKTLQAISIAYYYKDTWPLLIIVPSSVKFSWIDEIEKWLPDVEPCDLNLIRSGTDVSNLNKRKIHIMGYGLLSQSHTSNLLLKSLEEQKIQFIIMDESHYLKNKKTQRTKRLHQISKKAKHVILLSGTPSLARPEELYIQLDIVCPGQFGSFTKFANRYCDAYREFIGFGRSKWNTRGASNLSELHQLLSRHVMIRRLKKEVLTQLPPKRRQKITFDVSQESKYLKEMESVKIDFKKCSAIIRGTGSADDSIKSPLMEMNRLSTLLYHYTGLVKIGPIQEYISNLLESMDGKIIVFFRHRLVMKGLVQRLVSNKVKHICIAGDVPSSLRGDLVRQFQSEPDVRAAVLSIEAASFGLTLTAAHHVVFAELHYTPGVIIQAEDRAHRIGQTLPVNVHYLIARGTLDEIMWAMIRRKVYVTSSTLDGECKELQTEDAGQEQSQRLSACAAWVHEEEEDEEDLEEFVMEQLSSRTANIDNSQKDLRAFFSPALSTSQDKSLLKYSEESVKPNERERELKLSEEPITVQDSDDEILSGCGNLDDCTLIEEGNYEKNLPHELEKDLQTDRKPDINDNTANLPDPPSNEHQCTLKPKMLKFKKEKDGKLCFAGRKSNWKANKDDARSSNALGFVGNDPDTDSQTLRSYFYDDLEQVHVKTEEEANLDVKDVCGGTGLVEGNRSFSVSLKDADIECVAVVCRRTTSLSKQGEVKQASSTHVLVDSDGLKVEKHSASREIGFMEGTSGKLDFRIESKDSSCESATHSAKYDTESDLNSTFNKEANSDRSDVIRECAPTDDANDVTCEARVDKSGSCCQVNIVGAMEPDADPMDCQVEGTPELLPSITACEVIKDGNGSCCNRQIKSEQSLAKYPKEEGQAAQKERDVDSCDSPGSCCMSSSNDHINRCLNSATKPQGENSDEHNGTDKNDGNSSDEFEISKTRKAPVVPSPVPRKGRKSKASRKPKVTAGNARKRSNGKELASWSCGACTLINDGQLMECSLCFSPRVVTPGVVTPQAITPRVVTPRAVTPRVVAPRVAMQSDVTPRAVMPQAVTPRDVTPRTVTRPAVTPQAVKPRVVIPRVATEESTSKDIVTDGRDGQGFSVTTTEDTSASKICVRGDKTYAAFENDCSTCTSKEDVHVGNTGLENNHSCSVRLPAVHHKGVEALGKHNNLGCSQSFSVSPETVSEAEIEIEGSLSERTLTCGAKDRSKDSLGTTPLARSRETTTCKAATPEEHTEVNDSNDSDIRDPPPWSCSACTLMNQWQMIECSICQTPRRRSQRHSTSKWCTPAVERRRRQSSNKNRKSSGEVRGEGPTECERMEVDSDPDGTCGGARTDGIDSAGTHSSDTLPCIFGGKEDLTHTPMDSNNGYAVGLRNVNRIPTDDCNSTSVSLLGGARTGGIDSVGVSDTLASVVGSKCKENSVYAPMDSDNGNTGGLKNVNRLQSDASPVQSASNATFVMDFSYSSDDSNKVKYRPRKRLKLDECQINTSPEDSFDIADFSDSSVEILDTSVITPVCPSPEVPNVDDFGASSPGDVFSPRLSSPAEVNASESPVNETLEELKAAAETVFLSSSDWEDDDSWWEEGSSSGQSSFPSSHDTASPGSQALGITPNSGFKKCSDLYSFTDLQNKLLTSPHREQNQALHTEDAKRTLDAENVCNDQMPSSAADQENTACNSVLDVDDDEVDEPEEPPEPVKLKFCLSFYTDRVYLYDKDGTPLNVNFSMSDVRNRNMEDLPRILQHEYNLKQAKRFLQLWGRMGEGKRRVLRNSALIIDDPLLGYECARQGKTRETSYIRHPTEEVRIQKAMDTAEQVGGKVRVVTKPRGTGRKRKSGGSTVNKTNNAQLVSTPSASHNALPTPTNSTPESMPSALVEAKAKTCYQAIGANGTPLCLFCASPVEFSDRVNCSAWDERFCSHDCKKEYQVRVSGTAVRRNLFESERGICQLCSLNAHEIFNCVKVLPTRERPAFLADSAYSSLPQQTLKRMVLDPKEGMFWEADHVTPVAEGGGECGLENYRTLCILCHKKATEELNKRLRQRRLMQDAAGSADISTFFRPIS